jgi:hypothetical protein
MRHAGGSRGQAGIEGVATAAALRCALRCRLLDDRRRRGDLRLITRLGRLPIDRTGRRLHRGRRRDVGLNGGGLTAGDALGNALGAAPELPQALLELPVAILQLLVLPGDLPQLILKLLNSHFRVDIV